MPNFRFEDITHKPERYQNSGSSNKPEMTTTTNFIRPEIPNNPTLESAILFYEDNAVGEYANLYRFTANWLRRLVNPKSEVITDE